MATFVSLFKFTDEGIRTIQGTTERFQGSQEICKQLGVKIKDLYYTNGQYDGIAIREGDEESVSAAALAIGALGNTRTVTTRAYTVDEMKKITSKMP